MPTLRPGAYTAQIGVASDPGTALVEIYDLEGLAGTARLTNVSARTHVGAGDDALVAGFGIRGTGSMRLLVRAVGPTLAALGVNDVLADPRLTIFRGAEPIATNDDWGGGEEFAAAFLRVGAFTLPGGSRDSALLLTLPPGTYTAQVNGDDDRGGIALVEVYQAR